MDKDKKWGEKRGSLGEIEGNKRKEGGWEMKRKLRGWTGRAKTEWDEGRKRVSERKAGED